MGRCFTITAALWIFLAPLLCVGGVLDHHCDCDDEIACGHEDECAADPCRAFIAARLGSRSTQLLAQDSFPAPALAAARQATPVIHVKMPLRRWAYDPLSDVCRLPYPQSDMPLLL